jgi:hypothetical protein
LRPVARQPILPARGHSRGYQWLFRNAPEATAGQGAGLAVAWPRVWVLLEQSPFLRSEPMQWLAALD